jgi:hypothetical protein
MHPDTLEARNFFGRKVDGRAHEPADIRFEGELPESPRTAQNNLFAAMSIFILITANLKPGIGCLGS